MADKKISQLTALSAANLAPSTDVLAIVDTSATETKKIVAQDLINGVLNVASAVGIGTASPALKLDVAFSSAGDGIRSYNTLSTGFADVRIGNNTNNNLGFLRVAGSANGGIAQDCLVIGTGGGFPIKIAPQNTVAATFDTSGNLGLGVTPSAWNSGYKATQIKNISAFTASIDANFGSNVFVNSAGNYAYIANGVASIYTQNAGTHVWQYASSGTANNTISFTQAMTLDADGDLAIGATSTSDRLHVERNWNGSTWIKTVNTDSGAGAAAGMLFKNNTGDLGAISLLSSANSPADSLFLRSLSTNPLVFGTNNTERGRFTAGGYFKASNAGTYVGSTGTYHEFRQSGDDHVLYVSNSLATVTNNSLFIVTANRNTTNNTFYAMGYYNDAAAAFKLRVADSGDVTNTNGTYGTISDAKMKTDIVDAGSQWDDLKAVRFRKFKMKDDPSGLMQLGVVAQELEQTSPGLVDEHIDTEVIEVTDEEGNVTKKQRPTGTTTKSVKTSVLLMKAAVALQEAMARIESLEAKVAALEAK